MARPRPIRPSNEADAGVAVFLIGLRIRKWHRPDAWLPALAAMPGMLAELYADRDSGLLGHRMTLAAGGPLVVQYWASADDVHRYARDAGRRHRPAWTTFNARARRAPGAVGIWHELFEAAPGAASSRYVDMPAAGLAAALGRRAAPEQVAS